jgi:8-oxo-dGTP pyrophosphatase MutT (NUDIX family)
MSYKIFEDTKFLDWKQRLEANGLQLQNVEVLAEVIRNDNHLYGALLDCRLLTPEGERSPQIVVLRGKSAVIVPVLHCKDDGEVYTLMVEQRRIYDGDYAREFPAGGAEGPMDDLALACQELEEELHLKVSPEELKPLSPHPIKVNPSLCGDAVMFHYFVRDVSLSFLQEMDGRKTGLHEDDEFLRVKTVKMSEVIECLTSSAIIGLKLLEKELDYVF